jgi:LysR family transcriptional regulator for bpeEF and oprC
VEAQNVVRNVAKAANGLLTVSAPSTFGRYFLAPQLPAFRKQYPNVRVNLRLTAEKVEIGAGQSDLAIRLGPLIAPNLATRYLGQIDFVLVAAPAYL